MWARATRVEFVIVSVALLLLLLCSKPPRSGSADVSDLHTSPAAEWSAEQTTADPRGNAFETNGASEETRLPEFTDRKGEMGDLVDATLPTADVESSLQERAKRMAAVDARNCNRLDYGDVMYGEVTVRWVWNGTKRVPQKVCVVEEENGVSSVWSFDQQDDAILSEIPQDPN